MKKSTVGAILLIIIGIIGVIGYSFLKPWLFEKSIRKTSDASKTYTTIRIGGDNYLGYWFITSPEMRKFAARRGLQIVFTDDEGAYGDRLEKFAKGHYDCIVLPVNSYLEHGARYKFPGVIVASISESKGADGVVAFSDILTTDRINDLNDANLKIVYTSESPSSFLLDLTIADFDLFQLQKSDDWRVEVASSKEVYKRAKKNEGDVFVLWEPDLSKALELPGTKYLWGSDKFAGYIVDVFVFSRKFLEKEDQTVRDFLNAYFRVMSIYANNRDQMVKEMSKSTGLKKDVIEVMLKKIDWFDLRENASMQFGIAARAGAPVNDGLITTIIACTEVMIKSNRFDRDPLQGNPYLITNSKIIEELSKTSIASPLSGSKGHAIDFKPLDDAAWAELREVGTLRVEPITFQRWNNMMDEEGKTIVDKIAQMLEHNYPNYRIAIRGHTEPGGDEVENEKLSMQRAQVVRQYLITVHNSNPNRLRAEGFGSKSPPPQRPGESPRAYRYRLSRVEFVAFEENIL
ncbi:MAG: OmpA family protein [bacterium]